MIITSLEKMEEIVSKNKALSWDGWTVLESYRSPVAWSKPNAAFIKGQWYVQNRIEPTEAGWNIAPKFVR